jgi:hypothetical protein
MRCNYEIVYKRERKMTRYRSKKIEIIELFDEKTGEVVRTISFHSPKEFNEFIKGFKKMRYPGFGWRYKDKERKKGEHNLVDHYQKT